MHIPEPTTSTATAADCPCTTAESTAPLASEQSAYALPAYQRAETAMEKVKAMLFKPLFPIPEPPLKLGVNENGKYEVTTEDGFAVSFQGVHQDWTITFPDGRSTRIWGDPHVDESDGDRWDFTEQSTFFFGKNKATVETTPFMNTDQTVTKRVTIYSGVHRITIDGIDTNNPKIETAVEADGEQHDHALRDGVEYWLKNIGQGEFLWDRKGE